MYEKVCLDLNDFLLNHLMRFLNKNAQCLIFLKSTFLTLFIPGFLAGVVPGGGGVFYLHPVTPLSFKSDDSNFVQNYFGVGSIFCGKKNRDQK